MSRAVEFPNLPQRAETIIIGEKYSGILYEPLKRLGIITISVPGNPYVDPRLSGHADLSVFHEGWKRLWLAPYLKDSSFSTALEEMGFKLSYPDIVQSMVYPGDAQLNMCICGDKLIYNPRTAVYNIAEFLTFSVGLEPVKCRQGYSKCAVCVVDSGAIITADRGIAAASEKAGLDVLLISPEGVSLEGFDCGFIGGAAFKISREAMAFTGRLDQHPDRGVIMNFLAKHKVEPLYLTDAPVFDIGSGLAITEKTVSHN